MAMNVGSSTSATLRQTQQQNQTQQAKATQEAEQQARQAQQAKKPEQPKPVVNTQGQTTGKVINITA
jgi:type II secretory pathway pseudopilin PulG